MSIANVVRLYLKNKPYLLEALENGVANQSAMARIIARELGIKDYLAVKAAIRRYFETIKKNRQNIEMRALSVLKYNTLTLLEGIAVLITNADLEIQNTAKVKIESYYVYLTEKNKAHALGQKQRRSIIKSYENCSAIIINSAEKIESVSGVMAFVTSLFAEHDINLIELISCYTQTILVISRSDTLKAYELLSDLIK